jgi:hypothetical protein
MRSIFECGAFLNAEHFCRMKGVYVRVVKERHSRCCPKGRGFESYCTQNLARDKILGKILSEIPTFCDINSVGRVSAFYYSRNVSREAKLKVAGSSPACR